MGNMVRRNNNLCMTPIEARRYQHHLGNCGRMANGMPSPIEQRFLLALIRTYDASALVDEPEGFPMWLSSLTIDGAAAVACSLWDTEAGLGRVDVIIQQAELLRYRPDFILWREIADQTGGPPIFSSRFVVECDGHEYHERTPAQARHDRERDRELQAAEYNVCRFTGAEINEDAERCALTVDKYLRESCYRAAAVRHGFAA